MVGCANGRASQETRAPVRDNDAMSNPSHGPQPGAPWSPEPVAPPWSQVGPGNPQVKPRNRADLIISIVLMVVIPFNVGIAMFLMAFTGLGFPACSGDCSWFSNVIYGGLIAAPVLGGVGIAITIVMLIRRRLGTPWIASANVLVALAAVVVLVLSAIAFS